MEYLSNRRSNTLSNDPLIISMDDIKQMHLQNEKDAAECKAVTESTNRGESFYATDKHSGAGKADNSRMALYKECCFVIERQQDL